MRGLEREREVGQRRQRTMIGDALLGGPKTPKDERINALLESAYERGKSVAYAHAAVAFLIYTAIVAVGFYLVSK